MPGFFVFGAMFDQNWDGIDGDAAQAIEVLNHLNQANVIEAIVRLFLHRAGNTGQPCPIVPTLIHLKELHRTGTLFLLDSPGSFRNVPVIVGRRDGRYFTPPGEALVGVFMDQFQTDLVKVWLAFTPIQVAAFALWRINWVHPFKNGNGRTARAFAFLCMCLKYGFMLPGVPTVPDLIMQNRDEYEAGLAHADDTYLRNGQGDVAPLAAFLERLLTEQLSSIVDLDQDQPGLNE